MTDILSGAGLYFAVGFAVLLIIVIILAISLARTNSRIRVLEERLGRFMRGPQGESLENAMARMFEEHDALRHDMEQDRDDIDDLYERIHPMIQKVGVVKYDAFQQMGGNLSSAIVMLNEENNGFIINTVQSAEGCYSYVKEINQGHPDIELGKEEKEAYDKAMNFGKVDQSYVDAVHRRTRAGQKDRSSGTEQRAAAQNEQRAQKSRR